MTRVGIIIQLILLRLLAEQCPSSPSTIKQDLQMPSLNRDSLTSWRLRFLFGWVSLLFCACSVFYLVVLSTTLFNLSVSCWVLILFWSPTQVARSKVYSEGISIYSCKYIDQVRLSASLDTTKPHPSFCVIFPNILTTRRNLCVCLVTLSWT